ncbi:hypothetical protein SAMN05660420_01838 [Desulfuromusa kysingii]|uniref:Secreted protein n=1 Tax=Desulfuromusa kysingii TaxID=37625 RepID=A0A1H4AI47_9BACT|nr:hypothetical protein [Desulfuromusa kysingii]SEA35282.1 hypothetical protein SAMN05660420_01838 [Desulfuromusa kysingii]
MKYLVACLLSFLILVTLIPTPFAEAKTCKKYGPSGQVIYYACPEASEKNYRPQWKTTTTRKNGKIVKKEILKDSICYNYPEGSIDYRRCRRQTEDYFEEKCKELKRRYRTTKKPYDREVKIDMESFCRVGRLF